MPKAEANLFRCDQRDHLILYFNGFVYGQNKVNSVFGGKKYSIFALRPLHLGMKIVIRYIWWNIKLMNKAYLLAKKDLYPKRQRRKFDEE
jgi:hypothetical protein